MLVAPRLAHAYGAITHEAIVDAAWTDGIVPLLQKRYAGVTEEELKKAHAYAYGGCIIQDMGYYPFGNHEFTDLVHYVRTGDFVVALLQEAFPIEEYAFALGALEHYVADSIGHREGVNPAVATAYPELRAHYGPEPTWADDPTAHMKVEFGFDVLQVASGRYPPQAYHDFIGFKVATPLLERAFFKTYGIDLRDMLSSDLAIGTYRHAVSEVIPALTMVAWETKKDELERAEPNIQRSRFVYAISKADYQKEWDDMYEQPGPFAKLMAWILAPIPKFGRLHALEIEPPKPAAERLFAASLDRTLAAYRQLLAKLARGDIELPNLNLDTGEPTRAGDYVIADETATRLLDHLAERYFFTVTPKLRGSLFSFYGPPPKPHATQDEEWQELLVHLAGLRASANPDERAHNRDVTAELGAGGSFAVTTSRAGSAAGSDSVSTCPRELPAGANTESRKIN